MNLYSQYWTTCWELPQHFLLIYLDEVLPFTEQAHFIYPLSARQEIFKQLGMALMRFADP